MQQIKKYKLIVFDWDGTLMDSISKIVQCMQSAAKKMALPIPSEEEVRKVIGYSLQEAVIRVFPECDSKQLDHIASHYRFFYQDAGLFPQSLFSGAESLLQDLKDQGYLLAVATGKARSGLNKVLSDTKLAHYFTITRCADETKSKPHPQMLNEILQTLSILPHQALMVGDSEMDLIMANNANLDSVGVSYGAHTSGMLSHAKPKLIIDSLNELKNFLLFYK